jgi:DNA-binding NtrC family response regulator
VKVSLRVLHGPATPSRRRLRLGPGTVVIGGARDVDFVVDDPRVSRRHCSVTLEADGVRVKDLGSKNGTRVNGASCTEALVRPGGLVEVGDTTLLIDGEDAPVDVDGDATLGGLGAGGAALRRTFSVLSRAARSDVTVLLLGESGVGKDVVARALHRESPRKKGPFVVVDCGAIAPGLVGSELFGHKKGAFTSASEDRIGAFEAARGGTLFLDELGELPLELQPTLLRVLESRTVTRVGESQARPVDVRVVAATHRDLKAATTTGRFRLDLYHRLAVVAVTIPPLRERKDEILPLAAAFLASAGRSLHDVVAADRARLLEHAFPGNVRELKNLITRATALAGPGEPIALAFDDDDSVAAMTTAMTATAPATTGLDIDVDALCALPLPEARAALQRALDAHYLRHVLAACDGNVSAAARKAGVARSYLHRLLVEHPDVRPR